MPFRKKKKHPVSPDDCQHPKRKLSKVGTVTKGGITYEVWRCRRCGERIVQLREEKM
jgi:hypothetical protein